MSSDIKYVQEHLEPLGFDVENEEMCRWRKAVMETYVLSISDNKNNLFINWMFRVSKDICEANKLELLELLNEINTKGLPITTHYIEDEEGGVGFISHYRGSLQEV